MIINIEEENKEQSQSLFGIVAAAWHQLYQIQDTVQSSAIKKFVLYFIYFASFTNEGDEAKATGVEHFAF